MIELLRYLAANGFTNYIASGGDRDFMRPVTEEIYGIPSERVIGSSNALAYVDDEHGGTVSYEAAGDFFDDGTGQAGADLEPHRKAADPRRGQLEWRRPDAAVRRRERPAGAPPARAPRRRRARVRLHDRGGSVASGGRRPGLDCGQHPERLGDGVRRERQLSALADVFVDGRSH